MMDCEKLQSGDFAKKIGVKPTTLRNWRRIGIEFGSQESSGRWTYTERDVCSAKAMLVLVSEGIPLKLSCIAASLHEITGCKLAVFLGEDRLIIKDCLSHSDIDAVSARIVNLEKLLEKVV